VVKVTPRPLYPSHKEPPKLFEQEAGWAPEPVLAFFEKKQKSQFNLLFLPALRYALGNSKAVSCKFFAKVRDLLLFHKSRLLSLKCKSCLSARCGNSNIYRLPVLYLYL
jgi:hypothetical protein